MKGVTLILPAAGSGARAGFAENKVLRDWNGLPVLAYALSALAPLATEIIIPCRAEDEPRIRSLLSPFPHARTLLGGGSRTESVYRALREATGEMVLVHDGARPFVTAATARDCMECVKEYGSGVCALPATDTTVLVEEGRIMRVPPRKSVYTVQTPQGFWREELLAAFERAFAEGRAEEFTDESGIYAAYVRPPHIFIGARENRKLTYAEDFSPAERAGFGVDTHAFCAGDHVTLCGVRVPHTQGVKAHSDGDAAVHALMDALLSAAGMRDIGYYFPDTNAKFENADSMELLAEVMQKLRAAGLGVKNVSVSIVAERPRLAGYIGAMKLRLAAALDLNENAVGIAAGTNEKLGYVGEGKGITCYAVALLKRI